MKKLFLLFIGLALIAGNGVAQQYAGYPRSNAELKERMAYDDPYLYQRYKSASTLSGVGAGMTIGGVAAMVIGFATADKTTTTTSTSAEVKLTGTGAAVFGAGAVCALAGGTIWIIGSVKKKSSRNAYLREYGYSFQYPVRPSPYLQLNPARNGLELALVF